MDDLKYRARLSTSIDKGLHAAFYTYSYHSRIPLSRLADEAIEDFLRKKGIAYETAAPYSRFVAAEMAEFPPADGDTNEG